VGQFCALRVGQSCALSSILQGPTTQLQGRGLQGAKNLLRHQIVDRRGLEAKAHLFRPLMEVPDATVIGCNYWVDLIQRS